MQERLTEADISKVLQRFYERVRRDPVLAPPFEVVRDWDEHIARLTDFWSSLMLTTGRYKGNPVSMHLVHAERIRPEMFERWLELWRLTTEEVLPSSLAKGMQVKAARVAARLSLAIFGIPAITESAEVGHDAAPSPYKVSSTFDEHSVPQALLRTHSLKGGSWGLIRVIEGSINYHRADQTHPELLIVGKLGLIPPIVPHHLTPAGPVKFQIEFYDQPPLPEIH